MAFLRWPWSPPRTSIVDQVSWTPVAAHQGVTVISELPYMLHWPCEPWMRQWDDELLYRLLGDDWHPYVKFFGTMARPGQDIAPGWVRW